MVDDPQEVWSHYYKKIRDRRLSEAKTLWVNLQENGINNETVMALDFVYFSQNKNDAESLLTQLSENYNMEILPSSEDGYWYINGTTRPEGIILTEDQHFEWVKFMADVAHSHACVFSSWSFEVPTLGKIFSSEQVESD